MSTHTVRCALNSVETAWLDQRRGSESEGVWMIGLIRAFVAADIDPAWATPYVFPGRGFVKGRLQGASDVRNKRRAEITCNPRRVDVEVILSSLSDRLSTPAMPVKVTWAEAVGWIMRWAMDHDAKPVPAERQRRSRAERLASGARSTTLLVLPPGPLRAAIEAAAAKQGLPVETLVLDLVRAHPLVKAAMEDAEPVVIEEGGGIGVSR